MAHQRVLRTQPAAEYLGVSASWLEKLRRRGAGPRFIRLGSRAIGYDLRDLDRWLDGQRAPGPTEESNSICGRRDGDE